VFPLPLKRDHPIVLYTVHYAFPWILPHLL